eukprot:111924-Rhodomonas_salina.1
MARLGGGREEKRTEKEESRKDSESVVALAIRKGYREAALALLEGSVDQLDLGAAVLVCAVKECDPELVDALVLKGADVYGVDREDSAFQVLHPIAVCSVPPVFSIPSPISVLSRPELTSRDVLSGCSKTEEGNDGSVLERALGRVGCVDA